VQTIAHPSAIVLPRLPRPYLRTISKGLQKLDSQQMYAPRNPMAANSRLDWRSPPLEELKMATAVQESSGSKVGRHAATVDSPSMPP